MGTPPSQYDMNEIYCWENALNKFSHIGNRYYHFPTTDKHIYLRPRVPVPYKYVDFDIEKLSDQERGILSTHYNTTFSKIKIGDNLYAPTISTFNKINTSLFYFLTVVIMIVSLTNMKQIVSKLNIYGDHAVSGRKRTQLITSFFLSLVIFFLSNILITLAFFEYFRNKNRFTISTIGGATDRYTYKLKNLVSFQDGSYYYIRYVILWIIPFTCFLAMVELFILFFSDRKHHTYLLWFVFPLMLFLLLFLCILFNLYFPITP